MNGEQREQVRPRAEIEQLVAEFVDSDMKRGEFCHSRGVGAKHEISLTFESRIPAHPLRY